MFRFIELQAEEAIRKAQREGAFENLEGAGRPLALEDDSMIPADLRMAYKILKNANCLPPALATQKEIVTALDLLDEMRDEQERYRQIQKLNLLVSKLNAQRGRSMELEKDDDYYRRLVERISVRSGVLRNPAK
ncbi:DnaJ family domain-containing protein [Paucidesulfovibrio longus]|uniref:DnaJ family domain-containing protein n=1 Tax=Paucidesulfovibrio longus TaxID=889 RepID=UPI0003B6F01A|nr:DnaJ family domain-containing protein [Paucidesulfovibrio longus]